MDKAGIEYSYIYIIECYSILKLELVEKYVAVDMERIDC